MVTLLEIRNKLKSFYAEYSQFLNPVIRFLTALLIFSSINSMTGYMSRLNSVAVVLILSLVCSALPWGMITFCSFAFLLAHMYALSLEVMLTVAAIFLLLFLLYFVFRPGYSIIVLLLPLLFYWRIPFVVPIAVGLCCGLSGAIPVGFGTIVYYMIKYVQDSAARLRETSSLTMIDKYMQLITGLLENKELMLMLAAFTATVMVTHLIRKLSMAYSWELAVGAGALTNLVVLLIGIFTMELKLSFIWIMAATIAGALFCLALEFFVFSVDYSRTEYLQFQDNDYYYYVKAVPKVNIAAQEVQVKKITPERRRVDSTEEKVGNSNRKSKARE